MVARLLGISAVLALVSLAAAQNPPASVLLSGVREPAHWIAEGLYYTQPGDTHEMGEEWAKSYHQRAMACQDAVDKALAGGVEPARTMTFKVNREGPASDGADQELALSEVKAMCATMEQVAGRRYFLIQAEREGNNANTWAQKIAANDLGRNADLAIHFGGDCIAAVDKAVGYGVPEDTKVEIGFGTGAQKESLTEVREMCVYVRETGQKKLEEAKAAEELRFRPFTSVLSDDKLKLFNQRMRDVKVYGHGGRLLHTPGDYKASEVWCEVGVNRRDRRSP
ncbi:MAG TPA: hypothetical protein VE825_14150, partial [Terriglobales bacterium]|nr:hypothetical protein [Terriglobales bacterium]